MRLSTRHHFSTKVWFLVVAACTRPDANQGESNSASTKPQQAAPTLEGGSETEIEDSVPMGLLDPAVVGDAVSSLRSVETVGNGGSQASPEVKDPGSAVKNRTLQILEQPSRATSSMADLLERLQQVYARLFGREGYFGTQAFKIKHFPGQPAERRCSLPANTGYAYATISRQRTGPTPINLVELFRADFNRGMRIEFADGSTEVHVDHEEESADGQRLKATFDGARRTISALYGSKVPEPGTPILTLVDADYSLAEGRIRVAGAGKWGGPAPTTSLLARRFDRHEPGDHAAFLLLFDPGNGVAAQWQAFLTQDELEGATTNASIFAQDYSRHVREFYVRAVTNAQINPECSSVAASLAEIIGADHPLMREIPANVCAAEPPPKPAIKALFSAFAVACAKGRPLDVKTADGKPLDLCLGVQQAKLLENPFVTQVVEGQRLPVDTSASAPVDESILTLIKAFNAAPPVGLDRLTTDFAIAPNDPKLSAMPPCQ